MRKYFRNNIRKLAVITFYFLFIFSLFSKIPICSSQIPMQVHLFLSPVEKSIPAGILEGIEATTVRIQYEDDLGRWDVFQTSDSETYIPISLSYFNVPDGVRIYFDPDPLMLHLQKGEHTIGGSGSSKMYIVTEDSVQLGRYDIEIVGTCIVNETTIFQVQDTFYLSIEPKISSSSMIKYVLIGVIVLVVIIAIIIILFTRMKQKTKPL